MADRNRPCADDEPIRSLFARLRRADAAAAPDFEEVLSRWARSEALLRRSRRRARWALAVTATGMLALLTVLVVGPSSRRGPQPSVSLSEWRSPTDYLLEPPAASLLRGAPAIGRAQEEVFSCDPCF